MSNITKSIVILIGRFPDPIIWRFAKRYIAGAHLQQAMQVMTDLASNQQMATLDVLGEDTLVPEQADDALNQYFQLVEGISQTTIKANVSVKLTQMGLKQDFAQTKSRVNLLATALAERGLFLRFDIEDSTTTDATYELYAELCSNYSSLGVAIQAYLKRSESDLVHLLQLAPLNIRICKGIYREAETIAYKNRQKIRENYIKLLCQVLDGGGYPAIATHDDWVINRAIQEIHARRTDVNSYEFQMLYGVGDNLRRKLVADGHRVRVYIPFGQAWKAYALRRFEENPRLVYYILKNLFISK